MKYGSKKEIWSDRISQASLVLFIQIIQIYFDPIYKTQAFFFLNSVAGAAEQYNNYWLFNLWSEL